LASPRLWSISAMRAEGVMPSSAATSISAFQKASSSVIEVRWPLIVMERLRGNAMCLPFGRSASVGRTDHFFGPHQGVELLFRYMAEPERFFAQRGSVPVSGLRNFRRLVIADLRSKGRD